MNADHNRHINLNLLVRAIHVRQKDNIYIFIYSIYTYKHTKMQLMTVMLKPSKCLCFSCPKKNKCLQVHLVASQLVQRCIMTQSKKQYSYQFVMQATVYAL